MWTATYCEGGVRASYETETWRAELQVTLSVLQRRFGNRIIANLCRALAGATRLVSLVHLSRLNMEVPETSLARERNLRSLAFLLLGVMRELARVLVDLRGSGIERALTDPAPWERLDQLRRAWIRQPPMRLRDGIAFHFGCNTDAAIRGLEECRARDDRVTFCEVDTLSPPKAPQMIHTRYAIGDEVLLAAVDVTQAEAMAVLNSIPEDSAVVVNELNAISLDLLRQCGARV